MRVGGIVPLVHFFSWVISEVMKLAVRLAAVPGEFAVLGDDRLEAEAAGVVHAFDKRAVSNGSLLAPEHRQRVHSVHFVPRVDARGSQCRGNDVRRTEKSVDATAPANPAGQRTIIGARTICS